MFAALQLPDLPILAALRVDPSARTKPCAILCDYDSRKKQNTAVPLLATNPAARTTGIIPGWPLNRALVRCPDLALLTRQPDTEAALLAELITLAETFTPDLEITTPDTLLLDLSAATPAQLRCLDSLPRSATDACHALAETPDLAHLAVLHPQTRGRFTSRESLENLPLHLLSHLEASAAILPLLDLLAIRTLGDYRRLPRQELAERFGPTAGHWHDLLSGKTRRLLKLHRPPESLAQFIDLEDAIHTTEPLVFLFNRILHALAARLHTRHLAASALELRLHLASGREVHRPIQLPEPLADPAQLLRPLQILAESLQLESPVTAIHLDATPTAPLSRQREWIGGRQMPQPERWADTLTRLEALLGPGRVGIPVPLQSHRPDAFTLRSALHPIAPENTPFPPPASSLPLRRFRPPIEIAVAHESLPTGPRPLALLTGPHRGEIVAFRGPFSQSGDWWDPATNWRHLEWDLQLPTPPLLRLTFTPPHHWQLHGSYT